MLIYIIININVNRDFKEIHITNLPFIILFRKIVINK